ncbi:hypothetical protein EYF80_013144 [Liparis tanakae]|uniref:Uncharacterized protein n=1 Tax=Liparis tanakae TaxID=230148 RepID=A0A4Z2IH81_9TELE|nr:hypothetical protein EYF80_013144 [Liparis tanakae]
MVRRRGTRSLLPGPPELLSWSRASRTSSSRKGRSDAAPEGETEVIQQHRLFTTQEQSTTY